MKIYYQLQNLDHRALPILISRCICEYPGFTFESDSVDEVIDVVVKVYEKSESKPWYTTFNESADDRYKYHNILNALDDSFYGVAIKPLEIILPFDSIMFEQVWNVYKMYLLNYHKIQILSRQEWMMLKRLALFSDNNEQRAIEMIRLYIHYRLKSMSRISEASSQLSKREDIIINSLLEIDALLLKKGGLQ